MSTRNLAFLTGCFCALRKCARSILRGLLKIGAFLFLLYNEKDIMGKIRALKGEEK